MCFLCSKREFLLGLISQCQSSCAWAEMQTLTEAQLDSVVCFLKYWYKMNPAVRGVMPVKWLGVYHTFRKPAGAFEGCSLCDPKWDPAAILLRPWARHWKEWHVQTFFVWSYTIYGSCHASWRNKSTLRASWKWSIYMHSTVNTIEQYSTTYKVHY